MKDEECLYICCIEFYRVIDMFLNDLFRLNYLFFTQEENFIHLYSVFQDILIMKCALIFLYN